MARASVPIVAGTHPTHVPFPGGEYIFLTLTVYMSLAGGTWEVSGRLAGKARADVFLERSGTLRDQECACRKLPDGSRLTLNQLRGELLSCHLVLFYFLPALWRSSRHKGISQRYMLSTAPTVPPPYLLHKSSNRSVRTADNAIEITFVSRVRKGKNPSYP